MSFLYPYVLIGLVLPLILAGLAIALHNRSGKAWRQLVSPSHMHELVHAYPIWRTALPALLALLALTCTILAAARPINGYSESGAVVSGRNLIIALDVSRSMETRDVAPSRLDQAKAAATELIQSLPTDKIGLIVFSGEADLVVPLTYDHAALLETIDQVDRTWVEYGGTNLSLVLNRAMQDFRRSAPDGTNALVILSDGEETEDESLQAIARKAKQRKLLVIAVGVGTTTGDTIPDPQGENGLWRDARGKHVISKLQPQTLRKLAELTGGDFAVMNSGTNLSEFARHAVNKIDRHEEQESLSKTPNDLFSYFAITALILLVAAILLATDWRLPRKAAAAVALLLLPLPAPAASAQEEDIFEEDEVAVSKMSPAEHYAAGLQYLKEKKMDKAKTSFSRAMLSEDPALQAAAMYAMGNINTQKTFDKLRKLYEPAETEDGETEEAPAVTPEALQEIADQLKKDIGVYKDALAANPGLAEAKANMDKIQGLISKLEKEVKRMEEEQAGQENQEQEQENDQDADDKKEKDKKDGKKNKKDQKQKSGKSDKRQKQQQQNDADPQQAQDDKDPQDLDSQKQQQQQGKQGQQSRNDNKDKQDQQDQQNQNKDQQNPQEQQGDQNQQEPKSPQEKVDDLIDHLQDEIDRVKQQQKEKRTPKQQKEDAQDLIDNLKNELDKLKDQEQKQDGKQDKKGKKDPQRKDKPEKGDKPEDGQQDKADLEEAMKVARQLQQELQDLKDKAEKEEELSDEDRQEMQQAKDLIKDLQDEIRRLKMVQQSQQQQDEENKDGDPAISAEKEKERAEQRAESILKMSLDEEHGSPMPNSDNSSRTGNNGPGRRPRKDY